MVYLLHVQLLVMHRHGMGSGLDPDVFFEFVSRPSAELRDEQLSIGNI